MTSTENATYAAEVPTDAVDALRQAARDIIAADAAERTDMRPSDCWEWAGDIADEWANGREGTEWADHDVPQWFVIALAREMETAEVVWLAGQR